MGRNAAHQPEPGTFVAIVGPSGVGKDTIIRGLRAALPAERFFFPQRLITRPADGTEASRFLDHDAFAQARAGGEFLLEWEANGLAYAVPRDAGDAIFQGRHVVANLSRRAVSALREALPTVLVVHVTARPDVIEARLQNRGRETTEIQRQRLLRGVALDAGFAADIRIDNSGPVEESLAELLSLLTSLAESDLLAR